MLYLNYKGRLIMDISRKALIISVIINFVLMAICAVCLIITKWNPVVLWIALAVLFFVMLTSIIVYVAGKNYKK